MAAARKHRQRFAALTVGSFDALYPKLPKFGLRREACGVEPRREDQETR
jgi:hypothetical protein